MWDTSLFDSIKKRRNVGYVSYRTLKDCGANIVTQKKIHKIGGIL